MLFYRKKESAQGLVEYGLIILLVSITVIVAMNFIGPGIGNVFSNIGDLLNGV